MSCHVNLHPADIPKPHKRLLQRLLAEKFSSNVCCNIGSCFHYASPGAQGAGIIRFGFAKRYQPHVQVIIITSESILCTPETTLYINVRNNMLLCTCWNITSTSNSKTSKQPSPLMPEAARHRGIGGRAKSADQAFFATLLEQRDLNRRCSWICSSDTPHQIFDSFPTEGVFEFQDAASGKEDRTYRGAGCLSSQGTAPHDKNL